MATKKYLTYDGLTEYDGLIKGEIAYGDSATLASAKSYADGLVSGGHNHDENYDAKGAADTAESNAKAYADSAAAKVKDDLLNGAGAAYDTLKELGDLINENSDAIDALETVASDKADKEHTHAISDVTNLQTTLDEIDLKANESDVLVVRIAGSSANGFTSDKTFEQIKEAYDNDKYVYAYSSGMKFELTSATASKVWFKAINLSGLIAYNVTITSENVVDFTSSTASATQYFHGGVKAAAKSDADTVEAKIGTDGKLYVPTYPSLSDIYTKSEVDAKTTVDSDLNSTSTNPVQNKVVNDVIVSLTNTIGVNTSSISTHTSQISALETKVGDGFEEITSAEIQALFA